MFFVDEGLYQLFFIAGFLTGFFFYHFLDHGNPNDKDPDKDPDKDEKGFFSPIFRDFWLFKKIRSFLRNFRMRFLNK